jgi:hypothetical protein
MSWPLRLTIPLLSIGCAASVLAGCAAPSQQAGPPPAAPQGPFPPRPRDVRVDGIDPCALITPEVRANLYGLNSHLGHPETTDALTGPQCAASNVPDSPSYVLTVRLVTSESAQGEIPYATNPVITTIDGFGAVQQPGLLDTSGERSCLYVIDISPTQSLWVAFGSSPADPPPSDYHTMCTKTQPAAESVLQQLLAKAS